MTRVLGKVGMERINAHGKIKGPKAKTTGDPAIWLAYKQKQCCACSKSFYLGYLLVQFNEHQFHLVILNSRIDSKLILYNGV